MSLVFPLNTLPAMKVGSNGGTCRCILAWAKAPKFIIFDGYKSMAICTRHRVRKHREEYRTPFRGF